MSDEQRALVLDVTKEIGELRAIDPEIATLFLKMLNLILAMAEQNDAT